MDCSSGQVVWHPVAKSIRAGRNRQARAFPGREQDVTARRHAESNRRGLGSSPGSRRADDGVADVEERPVCAGIRHPLRYFGVMLSRRDYTRDYIGVRSGYQVPYRPRATPPAVSAGSPCREPQTRAENPRDAVPPQRRRQARNDGLSGGWRVSRQPMAIGGQFSRAEAQRRGEEEFGRLAVGPFLPVLPLRLCASAREDSWGRGWGGGGQGFPSLLGAPASLPAGDWAARDGGAPGRFRVGREPVTGRDRGTLPDAVGRWCFQPLGLRAWPATSA